MCAFFNEGAIFHNSRSELFHIRHNPNISLKNLPQQVADDIQGLCLDSSLKVRYDKLTENPEFVEKIATASCLLTPATRDII